MKKFLTFTNCPGLIPWLPGLMMAGFAGPASADRPGEVVGGLGSAGGVITTTLPERKEVEGPRFTEVGSGESGVDFANRWRPMGTAVEELTGPFAGGGVAIGDYDGDGKPDLFLTRPQGGARLYRNLGEWRFEDATGAAGLEDPSLHPTGASFVDLENDGDLDLHVCVYDGANRVYRNNGDGTFSEAAAAMGLDLVRASVMAAFHDYDGDGDLDAYLLTNSRPPKEPLEIRTIQEPDGRWTVPLAAREHKGVMLKDEVNLVYYDTGERDHLLRNNGDGTFTDVSREAGIDGYDIGLSATWFDANGDGHPDLYVANDFFTPDRFYFNNGDGTFTDRIAESLPHTPWYSMGSDFADINNDGLFDLLATDMAATSHYKSKVTMGNMQDGWFLETPVPRQYMRNALYLNTGTSRWMEAAHLTGLASTDWTWAVKFGDLDDDGRVDLFVANGMTRIWFHSDLRQRLMRQINGQPQMALDDWLRTPMQREPNLAYRNSGDLSFESVGESWGLAKQSVSFGAAMGDLDGDGDLDLVVNHFEEPVSLYRNNTSDGHRVVVRLRGSRSNRSGIGATVRLETAAGMQVRQLSPHAGFYSSNEPLLHFGLGRETTISRMTVEWPSGNHQVFQDLTADCLYQLEEPVGKSPSPGEPEAPLPWFERAPLLSDARHREIPFDDFARQPLLPNQLSQLGPGMAWADVDGDGDQDFYLAGAKGSLGQLFLHEGKRGFVKAPAGWMEGATPDPEEMAPLFFDCDGDGDPDLYLVSGGVEDEAGDFVLRDRLFLNDGKGGFSPAPDGALPDLKDSGSVATAADFDRDGDLDLFVGGRSVPGKYPLAPRSHLLRNDTVEGRVKFTVVTAELASGLEVAGMVTGALWSDANDDGWSDLLVTFEWGPVGYWRNEKGRLVNATAEARLAGLTGWWNGIAAGDIDGDGDLDYAVSNFGLNTKYHPTPQKPAMIFYGRFDDESDARIVEAKVEGDSILPVRGRSCSSGAMPFIGKKFPTFHSFALASLEDIYPGEQLASATRFVATELRSGLLVNDGTGRFEFRPLPRLAQIAPAFGTSLRDFNGDGRLDLALAQNFYGPQRETGRMAGGLGLLLEGRGDGSFSPLWPRESGLVVPEDARSLTVTDLDGDLWPDLVFGLNNEAVVCYRNRGFSGRPTLIELTGSNSNPEAVGARVTAIFQDGSAQVSEVRTGDGYLSQSPGLVSFGAGQKMVLEKVKVRWPDGTTSVHHPDSKGSPVKIRKP